MGYRHSPIATLALAILLLATASPVRAEPAPPLLLVLDASGSMWGQIGGESKIAIARRVLGGLVDGLEEGSEIGLIAYGHRREGDCTDIETVVPIGPLDRAAVKRTVGALNPRGKTPLTRSLEQAFETLAGRAGAATVVLVSDGLETCGGDPCATVRAAKQRRSELLLHVVGFDVAGEDVSQLECAAQAGEGLFLGAGDAAELSAALDTAVAMALDVPAGRLSLEAIADGRLQDAVVVVTAAGTGEEAGSGRTYAAADTNPRLLPLPDGTYDVVVRALGIKGDVERRYRVEITGGATVERVADFSTGELTIGVTRNGELSDAVFSVRLPGGDDEVAAGRTYTAAASNPARVQLTAGDYEVGVGSVEISGRPWHQLGTVTVEPAGITELLHGWESGTLVVGAARAGELVDATVEVASLESARVVAQARTYASASSNPKRFILLPGDYRITVREVRGEGRVITVTVGAGETVERMVDPAGG